MKRVLFVLFAVSLLSAQEAFAWGGWAHKLIAVIAEKHLTPEAKAATEKYLGTPIYNHATWMDKVPVWKKNHIPGWEQTSWWHMTTVDRVGKNKYALSDKRSSRGDGDLVPNLLQCVENLKNYRNMTDSAVMINLKCVLHMVGDMHCPSHIFYTEFEDCFSGVVNGKNVRRHDQMRLYYNGKKTTSHRVWDGMSILELYPEYGEDYAKFQAKLDNLSPKKIAKMCEGTPEEWALETARDCRVIYEWAKPNDNIDREFLLKRRKLTLQQYHRATYRLAHVLNECMK